MASNPMQQFSVHKIGPEINIGGVDLSFTNASLFMVISATVILLFLFIGTKEKKIVPGKVQLIAEMFYTFVAKMISDTAGSKAKPYFPFILKRGSFIGSAFKLGTELVSAVAVGTIIGFILDSWFDTKPWLIITFFFLGTAAGILNVIRTAKRMQKEE